MMAGEQELVVEQVEMENLRKMDSEEVRVPNKD